MYGGICLIRMTEPAPFIYISAFFTELANSLVQLWNRRLGGCFWVSKVTSIIFLMTACPISANFRSLILNLFLRLLLIGSLKLRLRLNIRYSMYHMINLRLNMRLGLRLMIDRLWLMINRLRLIIDRLWQGLRQGQRLRLIINRLRQRLRLLINRLRGLDLLS